MEARSQNAPGNGISKFFCSLESKEGSKKDYMESIGSRLRRRGNPYDWIKSKMERDASFTLVGTR